MERRSVVLLCFISHLNEATLQYLTVMTGTREMAEWFQVLIARLEEPGLVSRAPIGVLKTACITSSRGSLSLSHTHTHTM